MVEASLITGWDQFNANFDQADVSGLVADLAARPTNSITGMFYVDGYGSIEQATVLTDAAMTTGSAALSSPTYTFTSADVGKKVGVAGAGPFSADFAVLANDGILVSTVASVAGGVATLADLATTTTSGASAVFGFPIDDAFMAAADAAAAAAAEGGGTVALPVGNWLASETLSYDATNVTVAGQGRSQTKVFYVHTGVGDSNNTTPCFRGFGPTLEDGGKPGASFRDFTVDGKFFVSTGPWGSEMKLVQVIETVDASITNMAVLNCPATAIGYDVSARCLIADNLLLNAGRLAPISSSFSGAGGSGIGIAIHGADGVASCIIRDNFITGGYANSPLGGGRTGIHLEGAYGSTENPSGTYVISGNIVSGFSIGIRDSGALGTIISGNEVSACQWGVQLGTKGSSSSRLPLDTIVQGNVVRDLVNRFAPDGSSHGIRISTATTTDDTTAEEGRLLILGNSIARVPGVGIYLRGNPYPLKHVTILGNSVRDCDGYGAELVDVLDNLNMSHNAFSGNGRAGVDTSPIVIGATVVWTGGRIESNDFTDLAAVPTQVNALSISDLATLTGVRIRGNSDEPVLSSQKTSTTTINNSTTLATVVAFSLTLMARADYALDALIEYSSDAAAGLKLQWALPAAAVMHWSVDGAGAPDIGVRLISETISVTGTGVGVTRVARVTGRIKMGTLGGNLTLTAAQATATALNTVVTTRSVMTAARL